MQRQCLHPHGGPRDGIDQQRGVVGGREAELAAPGPQPLAVGRRRGVAERQPGEVLDGASGRQQRTADPVGAGKHGLSDEVRAQVVQLRGGERTEGLHEAGPGGHPTVDGLGGEVVVQHDVRAPDTVHGTHRLVRVGHHEKGEVRRAEVRRQPQVHVRHAVLRQRARGHEAERGHGLVELRVAHRPQRGQHRCRICHTDAPTPSSTSTASSCAAGVPASAGS